MKTGDKVQCRLFNTPEGKFYGDYWVGILLDIQERTVHSELWYVNGTKRTEYLVTQPNGLPPIWLQRKEIKRIIK